MTSLAASQVMAVTRQVSSVKQCSGTLVGNYIFSVWLYWIIATEKSVQRFTEAVCMEEMKDNLTTVSTLSECAQISGCRAASCGREDNATSIPISLPLHCVHVAADLHISGIIHLSCKSPTAGCPVDTAQLWSGYWHHSSCPVWTGII